MSKARNMVCNYCGQTKPMLGWRSVVGVGRCCADCVEELRQADVAKRQAGGDIAAWPRRPQAQQAAQEPAARGIAAGYDPRYQLPPETRVVGGFASMGIGRYLEVAA